MDIDKLIAQIDSRLAELGEYEQDQSIQSNSQENKQQLEKKVNVEVPVNESYMSIFSIAARSDDKSIIVRELPLNERIDIAIGNIKVPNLQFLRGDIESSFFTPEEASVILTQYKNTELIKIALLCVSDQEKEKYIDNIEMNSYEGQKFLKTITDQGLKYRIASKFLDKKIITTYTIANYFAELDTNYKYLFLNQVIEMFRKGIEVFDSYNLTDVIKTFEEKDRYDVLVRFFEFPNMISSFYLKNLLEIVDYNRRYALLEKMMSLDVVKNNSISNDKIILLFGEEDFNDVLKLMLDNECIDNYALSNLLETFSIDKKEECLDYLVKYSQEHNKKVISEYYIVKMIEKFPEEDCKRFFKKYFLDLDFFANIIACRNFSAVEDIFYYFDFLIENRLHLDFDRVFKFVNDFINCENAKMAPGTGIYHNIIDVYVKKYGVNKEHLIAFINRFNYSALKFMDSKSVQQLINLDDENFNKFMSLFNKEYTNMSFNLMNSICNSFLQRQFMLDKQDEYSIFATFEQIMMTKNEETLIYLNELIVRVASVIPIENYYKKLYSTYDEFIDALMSDNSDAITIMHDMTQDYIQLKRDEYIKEQLFPTFDKLNVVRKVEKNTYKKKLIETLSVSDLSYELRSIANELLTKEELDLKNNRNLLDKLIAFKKTREPLNGDEMKNLRTFETLMNKYYEHKYDEKKLNVEGLPMVYTPIPPSDEFLLGVVAECNIPQTVKTVLSDERLIKELKELLDKHKFLGWEKAFATFEQSAGIDFADSTVASLISNYAVLSPLLQDKGIGLTKLVDYANCYDSTSNTYAYLLGRDNYRLIAANDGKNKASMSKLKRLGKIPELIRSMYAKTESTVPPIDETYQVATDKGINVVIGNTTNMINLSYGERTNSCLRIGGAFNDMFEFCLGDKNGYHVRFIDPKTGEFISRVSGIRNGNTIFFNELRNSENPNYSNDEVIEALKMLSDQLIEKTKDSECPIENVVISYDYAMEPYKDSAVPSKLTEYADCFHGLHFNINKDENLVVIKTTNPDNSLVPYKFGKDLPPTYEVQRDKIQYVDVLEYAQELIAQKHLLDGILKGQFLGEIDVQVPSDIDLLVCGEDWYVYRDTNGNMHEFIIERSNNLDCVYEEMREGLQKIQEYVNNQEQHKEMSV